MTNSTDISPERVNHLAEYQSLTACAAIDTRDGTVTVDAALLMETAAALTALLARVETLEADNERLSAYYPDAGSTVHRAVIRADAALDWFDVLEAVNRAAEQMPDCEATVQNVEMPDGTFLRVDLNAEDGRPANVYQVSALNPDSSE